MLKAIWGAAVAVGLLFSVSAQAAAPTAGGREILPLDVNPVSYDVALKPDAEHLTFSGVVTITVEASAPTPSITLNADELSFDTATLDGETAPATVTLDTKLQRATLTFAHPVATGRHVLTIAYHGAIGRSTLGFFAMDYDSATGKHRTLATNFEPASERRLMPSWDEPGRKATFAVTVDAPSNLMAIGNMPVATTEALPGGLTRTHFQRTPKMSTYLLFLGVGDFERIHTMVDGTDVGVVVARGETEKGRYALGEAAKLLHFYNGYFGVKYPLPKLDLIAAPGEIEGGSMENWGAIFYSGEHLMFDPKVSTESDRQLVFLVVSHEMAHQWFGDLVTMAWWDNLWLNEGFARWMQTKAAVELHPEWKTGLQALAIYEGGRRTDAGAGTHPIIQTIDTADQASQAFDAITYNKGAAVITMLEAYAGPDQFRDGVRRYMKAHAFGNTVDSDLWSQVQAASGKPILEVEHDFTTQAGVPLIAVDEHPAKAGGTDVSLSWGQFTFFWTRFYESGPQTPAASTAQRWKLPLRVGEGATAKDGLAGEFSAGPRITDGRTSVTVCSGHCAGDLVTVDAPSPVLVNTGQTSYMRVIYAQPVFEALATRLAMLKPADQIGLMYDARAEGEAGYVPVTNYLVLVSHLPDDADPVVWRQALGGLTDLDAAYGDDPRRAVFRAFARARLAGVAARIGWDAKPGEDANASTLRTALLAALSRFDDTAVIAEAHHRFERYLKDPTSLTPGERRTVMAIVARHATAADYDQLLALLRATNDTVVRQRYLEAMAQTVDPALAARTLDETLTPDTPAGLAPEILIITSGEHPDLVWNFMLAHAGRPDLPIASSMALRLMPGIAESSSDPKRAEELLAYADKNIPASARQGVDSAVAQIRLKAKFRAEKLGVIDAWVGEHKGG
jgi:aminopeptidase N